MKKNKKKTPAAEQGFSVATVPENQNVDKALAPIRESSKYFLPKTWLSEKQVLKILQKTPREHVYQRQGKGGQVWDYVTGAYVEKVLNYVFGWNWDFRIVKQELVGDKGSQQVITLGELTVKDDHGHQITKTQNGRKDVAYKKGSMVPMDLGNDYKASATDCLKKCASLLGIASDLYGKQEFREIVTDKQIIASSVSVVVDSPQQEAVTQPTEEIDWIKALDNFLIKKGAKTKVQKVGGIKKYTGLFVDYDTLKPMAAKSILNQLQRKLK